MSITGNYDIYKSLFNFNTSSIGIRNPQTEYLFKAMVASKYTNSINKQLSSEINTFMSALNNQLSDIGNTMDSLFSSEENTDSEEENSIEKEIYSFKDSFNDLKTLFNDNSENSEVGLINKQIDNLTNKFEDDLSHIGLSKDSDGLLEIDDEKLSSVSEENPEQVEEVFNKSNSFGNKLKSRIKTIEELPKSIFLQDKIVKNSNVTNNSFYNYIDDAQKFNLTVDQSQGTVIDMLF